MARNACKPLVPQRNRNAIQRKYPDNDVFLPAAIAILGLEACSDSKADALARVEKFQDRACDCRDADCAKAVMVDLKSLQQSDEGKELKGNKAVEPLVKELSTCVGDAMMPPIPPPGA